MLGRLQQTSDNFIFKFLMRRCTDHQKVSPMKNHYDERSPRLRRFTRILGLKNAKYNYRGWSEFGILRHYSDFQRNIG